MKGLRLEKNKYGLRVYCTICKRNYNYNGLVDCNHPSNQGYKSIVCLGNKTKVKHHKTNDYEEALVMAITFKKETKSNISIDSKIEKPTIPSITQAAEKYLNYKKGIGVFEFEKREFDKDYLKGVRFYINQFIEVLEKNGYKTSSMPVTSIEGIHLNYWWSHIKEHYNSPWSMNASLRTLRTWLTHIIDHERLNMRNPFKDVKSQPTDTKIEAISKEEFEAVCKMVVEGFPFRYLGGNTHEKKNRYRTYLIDSFKLGLHTGLRREELVSLRWSNIKFNESSNSYIIVTNNLKVERMKNSSYKAKYIPVHKELYNILESLGWDALKNSELYIIEPFRKVQQQTMMDAISKGFSHYYKLAYPNRPSKQFKCLRKTYLSYLERSVGDNITLLSSHSQKDVLERHYLDPKVIAKGLDMEIF